MKPAGGARWNGIGALRSSAASALLDAPGVNEPEQHLSVSDLVTEDLALVPRRFRARPGRRHGWPKQRRGHRRHVDRAAAAGPAARTAAGLALADRAVDLLVADSPDRHGGDPLGLAAAARAWPRGGRRRRRPRPAVVATVARIPGGLGRPRRRDRQRRHAAPPEPEPPTWPEPPTARHRTLDRAEESQDPSDRAARWPAPNSNA